MTTAAAQSVPKSNLVAPIVLGIVLIPLSQFGVDYLGNRWGSFIGLLVGTPACYFLIGGLAAFTTVSGLVPAQARGRGAWVGFIAGISGACSAVVVAVALAAWYIAAPTQPTSLLRSQTIMPGIAYIATWAPVFPPIIAILLLLPLFLGANLFGIGLAPLGGLLGGYLRARVSPHQAVLPEQTGDQALAHSRRWILVGIIVAILLAVIIVAILLAINIIALAPHTRAPFRQPRDSRRNFRRYSSYQRRAGFPYFAQDGSRAKDKSMTTATARRISISHIMIPIVLGIILVPLAQIALWYLSVHGGSTIIWIGTPLAYYLIGGVGAFATVRDLVPEQARKRGALVGLITGIAGACSAGLLMAVPVVRMFILTQAHLYTHVNAIPRLPVITSVAPPPIPAQYLPYQLS